MGALLSFFGGSVFRMVWGEVSAWFTAKQEHKQELDRLRIQESIDQQSHKRQQETLRLQAELGLKEIIVRAQGELDAREADAFVEAMKVANKPTGIQWVDAWNSSVRPAFATVALGLWVLALYQQQWIMTAFDLELFAAIVGFFFADRSLGRRGK